MSLNDSKIRKLKPYSRPVKLSDSHGLYLLVNPGGSRIWYLKYRFNGKESRVSLGAYPLVSLAEARQQRDGIRKLLAQNINPAQQRMAEKAACSPEKCFKAVALAWHKTNKKWSADYAARILASMENHIFPAVGHLPVAKLKTQDFTALLRVIEDNLIEGLTVYFALKSGSATLTSLTAVTDQNGIATTSVRGAITGSVTVSAVTTAGGMQTVDITLVAGPADASKSVLKNNRSSLKGDFTDSAELHLVLHDISGNPIKVSEGLEFVQSGTNVPYMKISAIDYSQNINGDYKATITGGGEGIATLIPVLNGVHQAGLSTTIQFTRAEDKIMSGTVSVNGTDLPTTTFPSQGFTGAYYQLNNDNFAPGKTAADYEFSSSASWVDVDATGKVTFKNVGSNWERITATPKSGGPSYVYEIRVKSWWVNSGDAFMIYSLAENFCSSNGYTLPRADHLNHSRSRGIGSLYSEWGDMGHYTTEAGFQSNMYWSSSPANSSEQYVVSLATGDQSVFEKLGFAYAVMLPTY